MNTIPFIGNNNLKIACPACKTGALTIESNTVLAELLEKGGLAKVECHHSVRWWLIMSGVKLQ